MVDKDDVRRIALALEGVDEHGEGSYHFRRDGRNLAWPYLERIHPKRARVPRFDQFVLRVANADDKEAHVMGEPEVFFTTDHYDGYGAVIVRLDVIDESRLAELLLEAWAAAPSSTRLERNV